MRWEDIRRHYPQQWLLVEAIMARTEADRRVLEDLAVISAYSDSATAMKAYVRLHHDAPQRELYVFHTSRETLGVIERRWLGIRGAP